jgi:hypothetical protein
MRARKPGISGKQAGSGVLLTYPGVPAISHPIPAAAVETVERPYGAAQVATILLARLPGGAIGQFHREIAAVEAPPAIG